MWTEGTNWTPIKVESALDNYYQAFKNIGYQDVSFSNFKDSREYEFAYIGAQIDSSISLAVGEIMQRLTNFIRDTNEKISNPTTTSNAIMEAIYNEFGYRCSVKEMNIDDRGTCHIAIDTKGTPSDAREKLLIGRLLEKQAIVAGVVTVGDVEQVIVLDNGGFDTYRWTNEKEQEIRFRININLSRNSVAAVDDREMVRSKFFENFENQYWIGMDLEPYTYLTVNRDAPYASAILVEWSVDDGLTWSSDVIKSDYDKKYMPILNIEDIRLIP